MNKKTAFYKKKIQPEKDFFYILFKEVVTFFVNKRSWEFNYRTSMHMSLRHPAFDDKKFQYLKVHDVITCQFNHLSTCCPWLLIYYQINEQLTYTIQ